MNNQNPFELIRMGSRVALGMLSTLVEMLEKSSTSEPKSQETLQQLTHLLQELETKGKQIEQKPEQLMQTLFSSIAECNCKYPPFINRGGMQSYPQPDVLNNYLLYGFVLEGSLPNLQKLCDQYLNQPSKGKICHTYKPFTDFVLVTFGKTSEAISIPFKDRGFFEETETVIWMPVMVGKQVGPVFIIDHLAWFIPYIFIDNSYAMASGREMFGFPKAWGWFNFPETNPDEDNVTIPDNLWLETVVLKQFSPETKAIREKIIEVSRSSKGSPPLDCQSCNSLDELFTEIVHSLFENEVIEIPGLGLNLQLLEYLTGDVDVPMVFLKQFRDARYSDRACYQSLVEGPTRLLAFHEGGLILPGDETENFFKVKISEFDSHPIVSDLGLKQAEQIAKIAFWINFDFRVEAGREIWRT